MEEQRLRPMVENYNPQLFNTIYQKTEGLRRKLASGIDHRRFGVDNDEILSWFTVKFIFAYNKYVHQYDEDVLLGHMIKAMQFFKIRIIKAAYTVKYSQTIVEFVGNENLEVYDPLNDHREYYYQKMVTFMKANLSDNAYMLLQLQLNPPPYIINRVKEKPKGGIHKIPDQLIAEYFDLGSCRKALKYIDSLEKEIEQYTLIARHHFKAIA